MSNSRSPIPPGEHLAGKYRIDRELGAGSMGVVVKAWHLGLQQPVAIKFFYPEFAQNKEGTEQFRRKARAAAKLRSEHVAQVLDVGTYGVSAAPYIVMEHLDGRDIAAELKRLGALPAKDAIRFVLEACEAIGEAHNQGIVHRDLKPANLFLHQRANQLPLVKVLDFGIFKVANPSNTHLALTDTSMLMTSPAYMSPEQLESSRNVDGRADIWSLGVILHEMIMGERPFGSKSVPLLIRSILAGDRSALTEKDPSLAALEGVVSRCLEQDREHRYSSVPDLCAALRRCGEIPKPNRKRKSAIAHVAKQASRADDYATPTSVEQLAGAQLSTKESVSNHLVFEAISAKHFGSQPSAVSTQNGGASPTNSQNVTHHSGVLSGYAKPKARRLSTGLPAESIRSAVHPSNGSAARNTRSSSSHRAAFRPNNAKPPNNAPHRTWLRRPVLAVGLLSLVSVLAYELQPLLFAGKSPPTTSGSDVTAPVAPRSVKQARAIAQARAAARSDISSAGHSLRPTPTDKKKPGESPILVEPATKGWR